jgi:non-ribosomal peptide synthetase component F
LPFRRKSPLDDVAPKLGTIDWQIDRNVSSKLDGIAKETGATHFVIRLALFVALVSDLSRRSTIVIGTIFDNRRHIATRNIVGRFANLAPLVFDYDRRSPFRSWVEMVRDRLFETEKFSDIPYEELDDTLRKAGLKPPAPRIMFTLSADHSDRRFGGLVVKRLHSPIGKMPWGCQVMIDERNPEDCRVEFNANLYDRKGMQAMIDRYVRLIEIAARQPEVTIGSLVGLSSDNALRRGFAAYRTRGGEKTALRRAS